MNDLWLQDEFPHEYRSGKLYRNFTESMDWCVERMGAAAYGLAYDNKNGVLYLTPLNPNGIWYCTGGSTIVFKHLSDLLLFKLTFG